MKNIREYTNNQKILAGKYFKFLRLLNNLKIKDICHKVCINYKTYKDIENGIIKKNSNYYDELCDLYSIRFHEDFDLLICCFEQLPLLYEKIEMNDHSRANIIISSLIDCIKSINEYPYYQELYYSLDVIQKYYIENKRIDENKIQYCINLMDLWDNELSSILLEICEKANLSQYFSTKVSNQLYKAIKLRDAISKYWYARECVMHVEYIKALELFKELVSYFNLTQNIERKTLVMLGEFSIYRDVDVKMAEEYIIKLDDLLMDEKIQIKDKININHSIGMFYYMRGDFENSLKYFNTSFFLKNRKVTLLFIYACENKLNKLRKKYEMSLQELDIEKYIKYFEMKIDKYSAKELEEYLINELIPLLCNENYREPLWSMFEIEITQLVTQTRNYKKLEYFNKKLQLSTKHVL